MEMLELAAELKWCRERIAALEAERDRLACSLTAIEDEKTAYAHDLHRVLKTVRYLIGIAERGDGRPMRDDETAEQFVLGYVMRLESNQAERSE